MFAGVQLRLLAETDAEELFALTDRNREYLRKWLPWVDGARSVSDTREFIKSTIEKRAGGAGITAALRFQDRIAGVVGCQRLEPGDRSAGIGYWLGESFQGRGLMTWACRKMVHRTFQELGVDQVEIRCAARNRKSRAIPERLGFRKEQTIWRAQWLYDHYVNHVVYRMPASGWVKGAPE